MIIILYYAFLASPIFLTVFVYDSVAHRREDVTFSIFLAMLFCSLLPVLREILTIYLISDRVLFKARN